MKPIKLITYSLIAVVLICFLLLIDLPYELRFIKTQFNYLFVGLLYIAFAALSIIRFLLIEDRHFRKLLIVLGSMLIVFPCLFIFSVALQNFVRVKKNEGIDEHLQLVKQTEIDNYFQREYKKPDISTLELHGFRISGTRNRNSVYWTQKGMIYPTKIITQNEMELGQHFKIIQSLKQ